MTQEEKAKELVDRFKSLSKKKCDCMEAMCTCFKMYNYKAKQCALICVDEIIEATRMKVSYGFLKSQEKPIEYRYSEYWQEVKQQIEKL